MGIVTFRGTAKGHAKIDLAGKRVNDNRDVKSVRRKITVEVPSILDQLVCRRVAGRLMRGCKGRQQTQANAKENYMLWTVAIVLMILWALGMITGLTVGGFIHVLLVIALVAVLLRVISGRRLA